MRSLCLIISVAGAYLLLRGWQDAPGLLLRACMAVATLVAGLALWSRQRIRHTPQMACLRRPTWLDYLNLATAIILAEAFFVIVTSTLAAPTQDLADSIHSYVVDTHTTTDPDNSTTADGHTPGNWLFPHSLERKLPTNSNHKPSNKPEVFVELTNKQDAQRLLTSRTHLRSFTMARFDGTTWSATRQPSAALQAPIVFPRADHSKVTSQPIKHTVYHAANPNGQNIFTAFHGATSTDLPSLSSISDTIFFLPPPADTLSGYSYSATSRPVNFTQLIGQNLEPSDAESSYLDLPDNLAQQILSTSEEFRYQDDLTQRLVAIRVYLQENYTYSLETTNPDNNNPIANFLYQEKRGYCEHFATAATLFCRAIGVPSRVAYGWAGGKLYPAQNMFVFRAKDAHAWTEIKLKGYGWVTFDTTPPDDNNVPAPISAADNEQAPNPLTGTEKPQPNTPAPDTIGKLTLSPSLSAFRLTAALATILLCSIVFLLIRRYHQPETDQHGHPLTTPTPGYLKQFKQTCATLGTPMPRGSTLRQHIKQLTSLPKPPTFATELLEYHYATLYGNTTKNPSREKSLIQAIQQWQQQQHE